MVDHKCFQIYVFNHHLVGIGAKRIHLFYLHSVLNLNLDL